MNTKLMNFAFPITGGSIGGTSIILTHITWYNVFDIALAATIAAVVGGLVGYLVKITLDKLFKKS